MFGIFQRIEKDTRFLVDEEAFERIKKQKFVYKYKLETVAISSLKHNIKDTILPIDKTPVYEYLWKREEENYLEYVKNNTFFTEKKSIKKFDSLIDGMKNEFYDPKRGIIVTNKDGIIMDGLHRSCILLFLLGKDAQIPVLKLYYPGFGLKRTVRKMIRRYFYSKK